MLRDLANAKRIRLADSHRMSWLLVVKPVPLETGKQSGESLNLLLGRPHQELSGLDADKPDPDRVSPAAPARARGVGVPLMDARSRETERALNLIPTGSGRSRRAVKTKPPAFRLALWGDGWRCR